MMQAKLTNYRKQDVSFTAICTLETFSLLGWVGLGWVGLGWVGLGWVGLGWVGLGWVGLCCVVLCLCCVVLCCVVLCCVVLCCVVLCCVVLCCVVLCCVVLCCVVLCCVLRALSQCDLAQRCCPCSTLPARQHGRKRGRIAAASKRQGFGVDRPQKALPAWTHKSGPSWLAHHVVVAQ